MDREVTALLHDPFFSVILRRMFVRRLLYLFEVKVLFIWIMKANILSYSFKSGRRYNFVRGIASLSIDTAYFSLHPIALGTPLGLASKSRPSTKE
jgi:hypothetical protein